jgi:hypothetical protein
MKQLNDMRITPVRSFLVVTALLLGACGQSDVSATPTGNSGAPPADAPGQWARIPKAPAGWYRPEGAFWIDDRLVVVAGSTIESWNPERREWKVIAGIPQAEECEGCGYSETAVWTGDELLLWGGGFSFRAPDGSAHAGVSVDLDGNIAPLPDAPIPVRWWHGAIWTGSEMIVFGGGDDSHGRRDGAAYNPSTRIWREIAKAPVGGYANTLVWTGSEMITWGGIQDSSDPGGFPAGFVATGAAYDPETDKWRMLERTELDPRGWHSSVWTGEEMIVWGGVARPIIDCYDCGYAEDAGAYNPTTGTWRRIDSGPLSGRVEHTAVWTGSLMVVFGGSPPGGGSGRGDGGVFDLASNAWQQVPNPPIEGRYRHAAVWTGEVVMLWGGQTPQGQSFSDGASFRPN